MVPHEQNVIALEQRKNENDSHNPEAVGSNPAPATKDNENPLKFQRFRGFFMGSVKNVGVVVTLIYFGSVKNVGVEDTPRISEPLSFFEKTLFSSAPTGVSHR